MPQSAPLRSDPGAADADRRGEPYPAPAPDVDPGGLPGPTEPPPRARARFSTGLGHAPGRRSAPLKKCARFAARPCRGATAQECRGATAQDRREISERPPRCLRRSGSFTRARAVCNLRGWQVYLQGSRQRGGGMVAWVVAGGLSLGRKLDGDFLAGGKEHPPPAVDHAAVRIGDQRPRGRRAAVVGGPGVVRSRFAASPASLAI